MRAPDSVQMFARSLKLATLTVLAALPMVVAPAAQAQAGGNYVPISPTRILDTRDSAPLGPGQSLDLQVTGGAGVPDSGTTAVILNVTVTAPTSAGYLTVWPAGAARPGSSALNFVAGQTVANLVEVGTGSGGAISIFNPAGSVQVVVDLEGYVTAGAGGLYNPVLPSRMLDTRSGGTLGAGATMRLQLAGRGGIPATGVGAVALNLTAVNESSSGYLTAWPDGSARPLASSLNFQAGQAVANRAVVKLDSGGGIDIFNAIGSSDVVVDVSGWYTTPGAGAGSTFTPVTPTRLLDTRSDASALGQGGAVTLQVSGRGGIPAMSQPGAPSAVVANVTVTDTAGAGFLTVWPDHATRPLASDINWSPGATVPNLVLVQVSASGSIQLYNSSSCASVVVDLVGWFTGSSPAAATAATAPAIVCPPPPPPPPPPAAAGSVQAALINQDRAGSGLGGLEWNDCLAAVAATEGARMATQGFISHAGGVSSDMACGLGSRQTGENVGYWSGGINDDQLNTLFMNSPGHRANILGPYRFVGTAWVVAPDGKGYIAVEFG